MKAFKIKVNNKFHDYRQGYRVDLKSFSKVIEEKGYKVEKLWHEKRHAVGYVEKDGQRLFVKLATSEGMSFLTQNEYEWNHQFNKLNPRSQSKFWAPLNQDSGYFQEKLFYIVSDRAEGEKLIDYPGPDSSQENLLPTIDSVIDFSEKIQSLSITTLNPDDFLKNMDHRQRFLEKTRHWFNGIPQNIVRKFELEKLKDLVEKGTGNLEEKPRHGDFAPWHIFLNKEIYYAYDGEHALSNSVECYDIAYYIQRVFCVLENRKAGSEIIKRLAARNYDFSKLQTVLAARSIGGFLDRALHEEPIYDFDIEFKDLVTNF